MRIELTLKIWTQRIQKPSGMAGIMFLFALPLLSGVLGRLFKGKPIYNGLEFETILCAGQRAAGGESMYPAPDAFACEGLSTTFSYVYIPWLAEVTNWARETVGLPLTLDAYAIKYALAMLVAIGVPFLMPMKDAKLIERAPFLGLLTGSIVLWGNIAAPAYALLALAALVAPTLPLLFVAVVVLLGAIKQVWLTALAVVLLLPMAGWKRIALFVLGAVAGLAPTVWFIMHGGSEATAWREVLSYFAFVDRPGQGFLGWLSIVQFPVQSPLTWGLWLVYAAVLTLSALGLAERFKLSAMERVWLALAVATLLNPRLLAYEFFLIAPGAVALVRASLRAGVGWIQPLVYGAAVLTLLMNVGDLGDYAIVPTTLALAIGIVGLGARHAGFGVGAAWQGSTQR